MTRKVLAVGNCGADHEPIRRLVRENFEAEVAAADTPEEALRALQAAHFDLVLVNRQLYADQSDGIELIRRIKADAKLASTPVMLLSNYPQYQQQAVAAGAEPGFGKAELNRPETRRKLQAFLA